MALRNGIVCIVPDSSKRVVAFGSMKKTSTHEKTSTTKVHEGYSVAGDRVFISIGLDALGIHGKDANTKETKVHEGYSGIACGRVFISSEKRASFRRSANSGSVRASSTFL